MQKLCGYSLTAIFVLAVVGCNSTETPISDAPSDQRESAGGVNIGIDHSETRLAIDDDAVDGGEAMEGEGEYLKVTLNVPNMT